MRPAPQLPRLGDQVSTSLFTIEDAFVDSMCLGMSTVQTIHTVRDALEEGRVVMQDSVRELLAMTPRTKDRAQDFSVQLERGHYVVVPPPDIEAEVLDWEYGNLNTRPRPLMRMAVQQARVETQKAIAHGLDLR